MAMIVRAAVTCRVVEGNVVVPTRYGPGVPARAHVYVQLTDAEGNTGVGEASPLPYFTGETPAAVAETARLLAPLAVGCDALDLGGVAARLARYPGQGAAKCAVDAAAHDLAARSLGVPLASLLGSEAGATLPCTGVIGIGVTATEQAREHAAEGIGTLKMKVGRDVAADIRRVWAVRGAVGNGVRLRLDGNAGLSLADALALVRGVSDLGVELFEQPVRADDLHGMRTLREAGARILADESVHTLRDAIRVLEAGAADAVVIKLIKCGGLRAAREIAAVAAAYGAECVFVSPYETAVGMATTAHAAAAFGTRRYAHDLFRTLQDGGGSWAHAAVPGGMCLSASAPGHGAAVGAEAAARLQEEIAESRSR